MQRVGGLTAKCKFEWCSVKEKSTMALGSTFQLELVARVKNSSAADLTLNVRNVTRVKENDSLKNCLRYPKPR